MTTEGRNVIPAARSDRHVIFILLAAAQLVFVVQFGMVSVALQPLSVTNGAAVLSDPQCGLQSSVICQHFVRFNPTNPCRNATATTNRQKRRGGLAAASSRSPGGNSS